MELVCVAHGGPLGAPHCHHPAQRLGAAHKDGGALDHGHPFCPGCRHPCLAPAHPALEAALAVHGRGRRPHPLRGLAVPALRLPVDLVRQRRHGELLPGGGALPEARLLRRADADGPGGPRLHPALLVHARPAADPSRIGADGGVARLGHGPARPRGVHAGNPGPEPPAALRPRGRRDLAGPVPEGGLRRRPSLRDQPAFRAGDPLPAHSAGRRHRLPPRHRFDALHAEAPLAGGPAPWGAS